MLHTLMFVVQNIKSSTVYTVTIKYVTPHHYVVSNTEFYERIAKDSKQALIQIVSEAGHGKTSSLRTIIQHVKRTHPEIVFKIFDVSQAWYHCAPVQHRQLVTRRKMRSGKIANISDCVYEMGTLSKEDKRAFVGTIIKEDWDKRYQAKLDGVLDELPLIAFVFEESNIYFGSYSFRTNDEHTPVFENYVSVGRNYKMRGFLVATAEQGEMSPALRRRTRKIYGRLVNSGDIRESKKTGVTVDLTMIPKYSFAYADMVERVPDLVKNTPVDYVMKVTPIVVHPPQLWFDDIVDYPPTIVKKKRGWIPFMLSVGGVVFIFWMFISYFLG